MRWGPDRAGPKAGAARLRQALAVRSKAGFSFIELLVVLALILVLTTLYWGSGGDKRQRRLQSSCQDNLRHIHMALAIYANDFAGKFPAAHPAQTADQPLALLIPRYTVETGLFVCPAAKDTPPPGETLLGRKLSYAYYMGWRSSDASGVLMTDEQAGGSANAGSARFSSTGKGPGSNHGQAGGNLLFTDGHVEWSPARAPVAVSLAPGVVLLNPKP